MKDSLKPTSPSSPRSADGARFVVCRAAAGAGKTYTLVRQFLELAFSCPEADLPQRFRRILAITFTNKAANEMKERILRELGAMALNGADTPMGADIARALALDSLTLRRYASLVRSAVLHNYGDLAVCTIDSFVNRIVHTFAHDLGLPANFNIAVDNSDLVQHAVDDLMAQVGHEGEEGLTDILAQYAADRMDEGKGFRPDSALAELAEQLFREDAPEYLRRLRHLSPADFSRIAASYREQNRRYQSQCAALGRQGVEAMAEAGVQTDDFFHAKTGAGAFFEAVAEGADKDPNSYVLAYLEGDKLGSAKCPADTADRLAALKPRLQALYADLRALRDTEGLRCASRRQILRNLLLVALLNKMGDLSAAYSRQNEEVHISEFNKRIAAVVQDEPAPFIYERLGNRYLNYLIDEFQDTSRMQWQNLVPLVENGVGSGHASLVVGDAKQAIYRFRQGDAEQFAALPRVDNPLHGRLLESPGVGIVQRLERNFRTARAVVEFNNSFFAWLCRTKHPDNPLLANIYADLEQQPVRPGGRVRHTVVDPSSWEEPLAVRLADDIARLTVKEGYRLADIMLLARTKRHLAAIGRRLSQRGIAVVSNESFLLSNSRVVLLLRCLFRLLLDEGDRTAAAQAGLLIDCLRPPGAGDTPPISPLQLVERLRPLSLYDCCEAALRLTGAAQVETAYAATLLNVVARYSSTHRQDVGEFLEWLDDQLAHDRLSTAMPEDIDAVRLMTIHKSKGLEAPVVLYPMLPQRAYPMRLWTIVRPEEGLLLPAALVQNKKGEHSTFDPLFAEEEQKRVLDDVNIDYVAMTRPRDQLLLYSVGPTPAGEYFQSCPEAVETAPGVLELAADEGAPAPSADKSSAPSAARRATPVEQISFPPWQTRIAIAEQADRIFGAIDDSSRQRGIQIHELLSLVSHRGEAPDALRRYALRHRLAPAEQAELQALMDQVLNHPEAARFFDPGCESLCECSLVWQGEVLRPDRIVLADGETSVVDFKTGPNAASRQAEHRQQVQRYCRAVEAMGRPAARGFLLYVSAAGCQVVPC